MTNFYKTADKNNAQFVNEQIFFIYCRYCFVYVFDKTKTQLRNQFTL